MLALLKSRTLRRQAPINGRPKGLLQLDTAGHPTAESESGAPTPLTIRVSAGSGVGRTRLSAFDAALRQAGVGDFNLVQLSSVIPPGSAVLEVAGTTQLQGGHGDVLYCVYADAYASTPGEQAWAGIAWSEHEDGSRAGLFVEHTGWTQQTVQHDLAASLEDLSKGRGGAYHPAGSVVTSATCVDHPVAAVVIASFRSSGWSS
jgi:arginine decarboxylase